MQNPKDMQAFEKVVLAGMKLMYDKKTFDIFKRGMMRQDRPLPQRLAAEAAGLMQMLMEKSGGKIPPQVIAPAAAMLLMEMGKFMKESGLGDPKEEDVRQAIALLMKLLDQLFGKGKQEAPAPAPQQVVTAPQPQPGMIQQGAV